MIYKYVSRNDNEKIALIVLLSTATLNEGQPRDIVIIPPNSRHGFIELKTNKILSTLIRIDPEKVNE